MDRHGDEENQRGRGAEDALGPAARQEIQNMFLGFVEQLRQGQVPGQQDQQQHAVEEVQDVGPVGVAGGDPGQMDGRGWRAPRGDAGAPDHRMKLGKEFFPNLTVTRARLKQRARLDLRESSFDDLFCATAREDCHYIMNELGRAAYEAKTLTETHELLCLLLGDATERMRRGPDGQLEWRFNTEQFTQFIAPLMVVLKNTEMRMKALCAQRRYSLGWDEMQILADQYLSEDQIAKRAKELKKTKKFRPRRGGASVDNKTKAGAKKGAGQSA